MNLILPLNFGDRPCDRTLLAMLRDQPPASTLWSAFRVWKDFGIARADRREVPLDPAARAVSPAVSIIEQFAGWQGESGDFVTAAINAGFFKLEPATPAIAELILVDFFPANFSEARTISNSKLGGIAKGVNIARRRAEASTLEQLDLFAKTGHSLLAAHGREELNSALLLIYQVCNMLRRPPPSGAEWQPPLTVSALNLLTRHSESDREIAFKWFIANRTSPEIPPRLEFILDRFSDFVAKGQNDFK